MAWIIKHQELAIKNGWWQSATNLATYIYKSTNNQSAIEFEFDAAKFQKYMIKLRGKPYHRTLIPRAMAHLEENSEGLIVILRDYKRGIYKLLVRPISFLKENRHSQRENRSSQNVLNPIFSEEQKKRLSKQQQQDINNLDRLFKKIGVDYDNCILQEIWRLAGKCMKPIQKTLDLMFYRHSTSEKGVLSPSGFIIDCLKKGWYKKFDIYYQIELPTFNSCLDIAKYVSDALNEISSQKNGASDEIIPTPT